MKGTKHIALSLTAVLLSCLMAGCGRAEEEAKTPQSDSGDFVYVSETLPKAADTVTNFSATENHLFFLRQENSSYTVCRIPLSEVSSETDFSDSETALALPAILSSLPEDAPAYDFARILDYAIDTEQNLYCLAALYKANYTRDTYIVKGGGNPRPEKASKLSGRLSIRLFEASGSLLVQSDDSILCQYDQKTDSLSEILKWEDQCLKTERS